MSSGDTVAQWTDRLAHRPEVFPHQINLVNESLLLVELSESEIESASFLDQRVLTPSTPGSWVPWSVVAETFEAEELEVAPGYIFHVGHCGSTLLSRLLQYCEGTRSLREPLPLRTLAQDCADDTGGLSYLTHRERVGQLRTFAKMWLRGARNAVIKATSICTDLLPHIKEATPGTKSLFVYNRPDVHLATLLAGQNALMDLRGFAPLRLKRFNTGTGLELVLNQLTLPQLAALSWLSETTSISKSLESFAGDIALLEFDALLRAPGDELQRALQFLELPVSSSTVESAISGPVLQTYSKAPEHKYDAQTRTDILSDAMARYDQEIRQARQWIDDLGKRSSLVADSLDRFG